jgi:hypothetical protein
MYIFVIEMLQFSDVVATPTLNLYIKPNAP